MIQRWCSCGAGTNITEPHADDCVVFQFIEDSDFLIKEAVDGLETVQESIPRNGPLIRVETVELPTEEGNWIPLREMEQDAVYITGDSRRLAIWRDDQFRLLVFTEGQYRWMRARHWDANGTVKPVKKTAARIDRNIGLSVQIAQLTELLESGLGRK
jgi:hypothetical protein